MHGDTPIDDTLLGAWLDGELAEPERLRVEAWLQAHPDDAARVRQWAADAQALRSRLGPLADAPLPPGLQRRVWQRARPAGAVPRWALAASAAGLLVLGAGVGAGLAWRLHPGAAPSAVAAPGGGWVARAAVAHALYTTEPRHAVEVRAQEAHLARWLTARIQHPVKLFDLQAMGFELVGGRLLPDGSGRSAQLMYQDNQGVRVTVYLRRPEAGTQAAFRYERQGELGLFYWVEDGLGYALVGALPKERLLALAQSIHRQHPASTPPAAASAPGS
ncbi:anti-sigma factor family protein [Rubrivivax sp. RP6-9]|uniref:anti-sigma factor family protein n=1 Tax=Rubrivivax sp. RP6-9 TaxID=3415750 RepID=UPI003CC637AE